MFKHSRGYIFEARKDAKEKIGIIEGYKTFNGKTTIIFGVTQQGNVGKAVYCDKHLGFLNLSDLIPKDCTDEDMEQFLRSRRGLYAVLGNVTMVGVAKVDIQTNKVLNLSLYTPIEDSVCDDKPVVIFEKLSTVPGFHHHIISESIYNSFITKLTSEIIKMPLGNKRDYYKYRLSL